MAEECVLALDLGTTAFKAAPVSRDGVLGQVVVVPYALDYRSGGRVTCDPARYVECAMKALRGAAGSARRRRLRVRQIGISSQAQTLVPVDGAFVPTGPAIVWTDSRARREAREAAAAMPDFAWTAGFLRPLSVQFFPKVMWLRRRGCRAARYLLLNEWMLWHLTGQPLGDTTNQGMGGFYDLSRGAWNVAALDLAGIGPENLADVAAPGAQSAPLKLEAAAALGLERDVRVFSCGNDQSCAAIGAGADTQGTLFANFGTALVLYALTTRYVPPYSENQISGISPLTGYWFRLGVESECGNVIEWLAKLLYPREGIGAMLEQALNLEPRRALPSFHLRGSGTLDLRALRPGTSRQAIARAVLEHYARRFGELLGQMRESGEARTEMVAGGGLSRSEAWISHLSRRFNIAMKVTACEHPGLVGAARVIAGRCEGSEG